MIVNVGVHEFIEVLEPQRIKKLSESLNVEESIRPEIDEDDDVFLTYENDDSSIEYDDCADSNRSFLGDLRKALNSIKHSHCKLEEFKKNQQRFRLRPTKIVVGIRSRWNN
jgi:hypothetical protein